MNGLINKISNVKYNIANKIIRQKCGIVNYFSSDDEKADFIAIHAFTPQIVSEDRVAFGDWQTPMILAEKVCDVHLSKFGNPDIVIEPTCGLGAFVFAALKKFKNLKEIHAIEINNQYVDELKYRLLHNALTSPSQSYPDIYISNANFFDFDIKPIIDKCRQQSWRVGIIGNPPWVTNSQQGRNKSNNLPTKINSYGLKGIEAITGKSNFDISEYITILLLKLSHMNDGGISFLLKNSVIRNIIEKQHIEKLHIGNIEQRLIDASSEFNVSVDASCLFAHFNTTPSFTCDVLDLYSNTAIKEYGWVNDSFVSDIKLYNQVSKFDNKSSYTWRSGIKHDCADVLELTFDNGVYINGLGENVEIESDLIYPLLKSSDINNYKKNSYRKYIIVPQHKMGEDTSKLEYTHPLTYAYLKNHEAYFLKRKSSIYVGKDKFSVFGIGDYSFKPYKIVVSSLYKTPKFILLVQSDDKPIMVDDTCYQLDFENIEEAKHILDALTSSEIQSLLQSLAFKDSKRVITKSLLMRIDLVRICREKGISINSQRFNDSICSQLSLFE